MGWSASFQILWQNVDFKGKLNLGQFREKSIFGNICSDEIPGWKSFRSYVTLVHTVNYHTPHFIIVLSIFSYLHISPERFGGHILFTTGRSGSYSFSSWTVDKGVYYKSDLFRKF